MSGSAIESGVRTCGRCGVTVPYEPGQPTWCECGWIDINWLVSPPEPAGDRRIAQLLRRLQDRTFGLGPPSGFGRIWSSVVGPAFAVALAVIAFLLGPLLIWSSTTVGRAVGGFTGTFLATGFFVAGLVTFPYPRLPRRSGVKLDTQPLLFGVVQSAAQNLRTPVPTRVVVTSDYTAGISTQWGRHTLLLGLPLVAAYSVDELVFIIGHELGHLRRKRVFRGWLSDRGVITLLRSRDRLLYLVGVFQAIPYGQLGALVLLPIRWLCLLLARLLRIASWSTALKTELDCDRDGAALTGSEAATRALAKLHLSDAARRIAARTAAAERPDPYREVVQHLRKAPPRTIAFGHHLANRHASVLTDTIWDTHPATSTRLGMMKQMNFLGALPMAVPNALALEAELAHLCAGAAQAWGAALRDEYSRGR